MNSMGAMRGIFALSACQSALWKGSLAFSESGKISSECLTFRKSARRS